MTTVHIVLHAHLDPIWLWPWQAGLDEALATCRSACDRLDRHPDAVFTQGEAWVYRQIEEHDPHLFERIRAHIEGGRWEITGGWWIQPDCNSPGGLGLQRQIACGKAYFMDRFGRFPRVAFNTDSFGHAATLPGFMAAAGQACYVMMRPQEHELALPARLFRWRGYTDGPEILTFRIARSYNALQLSEDHLRAAASELPEGIFHTMCFAGVGDHGGGATDELINWIREHRDAFEGLRLEFSSPSRFFDAVEPRVASVPEVVGELQHHAVGCYSVHRPVHCGVKAAEQALLQTEVALDLDPQVANGPAQCLAEQWRTVAFMQFHDTLGGTCLPSAYHQVTDALGGVRAFADRAIHGSLRRQLNALAADPRQRLVFFNASDRPFDDWVEAEPWMGQRGWDAKMVLTDEAGGRVPYQPMRQEAIVNRNWPGRLCLPLRVDPGELRILHIEEDASKAEIDRPVVMEQNALDNGFIRMAWASGIKRGETTVGAPAVHLIDDPSDTWSHGIDRYAENALSAAMWGPSETTEKGPLLTECTQAGRIGRSDMLRQIRLYAGVPWVEVRYRVDWNETHKVLKVVLPLGQPPSERVDGISGGHLVRDLDGVERPIQNWMLLRHTEGMDIAVVCPWVFAADATPGRLRLTWLRSPRMAHHVPHPGRRLDGRYSDRGEHDLSIRIVMAGNLTAEALDRMAFGMMRPPIYADLTRGMPAHV